MTGVLSDQHPLSPSIHSVVPALPVGGDKTHEACLPYKRKSQKLNWIRCYHFQMLFLMHEHKAHEVLIYNYNSAKFYSENLKSKGWHIEFTTRNKGKVFYIYWLEFTNSKTKIYICFTICICLFNETFIFMYFWYFLL